MPPERYWAPASEPSASRLELMSCCWRAMRSWAVLTSGRSYSARSSARLYASVAFSASV
jgi:hypothetical protein